MIILLTLIAMITFIAIKAKNKYLSWKSSAWLASAYLAGLLLLVPLLYGLPTQDFAKPIKYSENSMTLAQQPWNLSHYVTQAYLDKQKGIHKNSSQTFKLEGHKLGFKIAGNPGSDIIYINRKNVSDGEIKVDTYVATHFVEGIDFTKQILPPDISLQNGILSISDYQQRLNFKRFQSDFTLAQFKMNHENDTGAIFGGEFIYISVPKSLEIDKGNGKARIISND